MTNYNFENLVIAGLGEYVSGEIHGLTHHSAWCNAIKNAQAVGELISFMLVDLLAHFKHINFVTIQVPGHYISVIPFTIFFCRQVVRRWFSWN